MTPAAPPIVRRPIPNDGAATSQDLPPAFVGRGRVEVLVFNYEPDGKAVRGDGQRSLDRLVGRVRRLDPPRNRRFGWGDTGPSSRALARALLREIFDEELVKDMTLEFTDQVVSRIDPRRRWEIPMDDVMDWVMTRAVSHG